MLLAFFQSVLLTGATVHSMVPGEAPARRDVLIQRDLVSALLAPGATQGVPAEAKRVDLSGMHLIPGLIDGFVNHDPDHDRLYVASGVTLVRDQGGDLTPAMAERDLLARDRGPGPWIHAAGAPLVGAGARTGIVVGSPEEVQQKLARIFNDYHLDYLSIQPGLSADTWRKILDVAHEHHLQVWGPLVQGVTLEEALGARQDGLFHLGVLLPPGKNWGNVSAEELAPRLDALANSSTALVPTLALHAARIVQPKKDAPELLHLAPIYVQQWTSDALQREAFFTGADALERQKAAVAALALELRTLKGLWEKHARLVPGSASPNAWLFPGHALIDELSLWVRAGIAPADVLRAATQGAAKLLGVDDRRGTIAVGKVADLVACAGDPEADLAALREPRAVVLRGRVLDRAALDALVDDLERRQVTEQKRVLGREPLPLAELDLPIGKVLLSGRAEQRLASLRLAAERFAVVQRSDGSVSYVTRMLTLGSTSLADTELTLTQTLRDDLLVDFDLEVKSGPRVVKTKGTRAGSALNVERRMDGNFVDNVPVRDALRLVDVGSVLSSVIAAHHGRDGEFKALYFEDFEAAYGPWIMRIDADGTLLWHTQNGAMSAQVDPQGKPLAVHRERGREIVDWSFTDVTLADGGFALPDANRVPSKRPDSAPASGAAPR